MRFSKLLLLLSVGFFILPVLTVNIRAETKCDNLPSDQKPACLTDLINEYKSKISELQGKQKTLASTIAVLDNQTALTQAQISNTEQEVSLLKEEINKLSLKIGQLDLVLKDVSEILGVRIEETYKLMFISPIYYLIKSGGFADFFSRFQYLKSIQSHDKELLFSMEETKLNLDSQKNLKEDKQNELVVLQQRLEKQKNILGQQKASKQELLNVTKNDEQNFQNLLAKARAEFEAIQSILAGNGDEVEIGKIQENEAIASIINSASTCSTGAHLHFEVVKNNVNNNPAAYLKSKEVNWNLDGWYGHDDPFAFTGSWEWPINGKPTINQGYGMTAYARSGAYGGGGHTGLDMIGDGLSVKAVKPGTLYRGSIACGGGTLRYVKVEQTDSIATYYLHVNYIK